jgi:hypothetical protein
MLTVLVQNPTEFSDYALDLLREQLGVSFAARPGQADSTPVDLYHGNDTSVACVIRIPDTGSYNETSIPLLPGGADRALASTADAPFPFDLFAAIRFWLADEANAAAPASAFDAHDLLLAAHSAQARLGVLDAPVVNAYLQLFRQFLQARLRVGASPWIPEGKRCVVVLSHDADTPIDPGDPRHAAWRARKSLRRGEVAQAGRHALSAAARAARWPLLRGERNWLFDELTRMESKLGFRSTFFFSARSRSDPHGSPYDESYDLDAPRFRRLLERLHAEGFEVGLHASYEARVDVRRLQEERERIECISGLRVLGNRHHYWHMRRPFWPTLDDHGSAGLAYDSSVAFDETSGYRLGFAFPCRLWNPLRGSCIQAIQVPTLLMDGGYFYRPGQTVDAVVADFARLLDNLKRFEGVAAINWHPRGAAPRTGARLLWGRAFQAILELLASDSEVAVQSFSQLLQIEQTRTA